MLEILLTGEKEISHRGVLLLTNVLRQKEKHAELSVKMKLLTPMTRKVDQENLILI